MATTGGFTSTQLLNEEHILTLPTLDLAGALEIGEIAKSFAVLRSLPIAIQVRLIDWIYVANINIEELTTHHPVQVLRRLPSLWLFCFL